jgi:hypothetical protein
MSADELRAKNLLRRCSQCGEELSVALFPRDGDVCRRCAPPVMVATALELYVIHSPQVECWSCRWWRRLNKDRGTCLIKTQRARNEGRGPVWIITAAHDRCVAWSGRDHLTSQDVIEGVA